MASQRARATATWPQANRSRLALAAPDVRPGSQLVRIMSTRGDCVLNAAAGWWQADPLAGYVLVFYAARETRGIRTGQH
jgi:hypothetical protein